MVLVKVHPFAIPMGSHGLHWSYVVLKIIYYWLKRYNIMKCKMLYNFSILAGMDGSCAVDCGDTLLPGCIRGTRGNRPQRFQWDLVVPERVSNCTLMLCAVCVYCSFEILLGYTSLTSACTIFHRGGNSRFVIFRYKNSELDLDDNVPVLCSAQVVCSNSCESSY